MNLKRNYFLSTALLSSVMLSVPSMALNIVVTNDDGWDTANIKNLKDELVKAGHDVIMSAPCGAQSGKGGSMTYFKAVPIDLSRSSSDEYCVGETDGSLAFDNYVNGSPVMAALYGIDVLAQEKWGANPDLVIAGLNEGNNLGFLNNNSGTLGATMISLSKGVPAIALSAGISTTTDSQQSLMAAQVAVKVVQQLEVSQEQGQPILPAYTGLNINTPEDMNSNLGYKFTDVGWNGGGTEMAFSKDLGSEVVMQNIVINSLVAAGMTQAAAEALFHQKYDDQAGLVFTTGDAGDTNENSEGVAVQEGYITISTIDGNVQASRAKVALTQQHLIGLE